jgi:hypothetical protein
MALLAYPGYFPVSGINRVFSQRQIPDPVQNAKAQNACDCYVHAGRLSPELDNA